MEIEARRRQATLHDSKYEETFLELASEVYFPNATLLAYEDYSFYQGQDLGVFVFHQESYPMLPENPHKIA